MQPLFFIFREPPSSRQMPYRISSSSHFRYRKGGWDHTFISTWKIVRCLFYTAEFGLKLVRKHMFVGTSGVFCCMAIMRIDVDYHQSSVLLCFSIIYSPMSLQPAKFRLFIFLYEYPNQLVRSMISISW
jgi:hypothetical protein